jgi:5-methylcytosine-specific restriction endonuclease McrA
VTGDPLTPLRHVGTCSDCGERLPLTAFGKDKAATGGRRSHCKICRSRRSKAWYAQNAERQAGRQKARVVADRDAARAINKLSYEKNRERRIAEATDHGHRRRARQVGAPSDKGITVRALRTRDGDNCRYCGCLMDFRPGPRTYRPLRATVEHVIPLARGGHHVWANIVLACWACNLSKNRLTLDEWRAVTATG